MMKIYAIHNTVYLICESRFALIRIRFFLDSSFFFLDLHLFFLSFHFAPGGLALGMGVESFFIKVVILLRRIHNLFIL